MCSSYLEKEIFLLFFEAARIKKPVFFTIGGVIVEGFKDEERKHKEKEAFV